MKEYYDDNIISNIRYELANFNYDKVHDILEKYIMMYPEDTLGKVYKAEYLKRIGKKEEALNYIENIPKRFHSGYVELIYMQTYASILDEMKMLDDAEKMYIKSFNFSDKDDISTVQLASFYMRHEEYEKAEKVFNKSNKKEEPIVKVSKAKLLYKEENYNDAIKILESLKDKMLEKETLNFKRFYLGISYFEIDDIDNAYKNLSKVRLNRKGYMASKYLYLTQIAYKKKDYKEALNYIKDYLSYGGKENNANFYLFRINVKLGNKEEARKIAEQIEDSDTDKLTAFGDLEYSEGEYQDAERYYSKSLSLSAKNFSHNLMGMLLCYLREGKFENLSNTIYYVEDDINKEKLGLTLMLLKATLAKVYNKPVNYEKLVYSEKQVYNYSENLAKVHILSHHKGDFNNNIDDIFLKATNMLSSDNIETKDFFDKHNINIDGKSYTVVSIPDTNEIITMYKDEKEKEKPKEKVLKRKSQIEKFREKYGNNF